MYSGKRRFRLFRDQANAITRSLTTSLNAYISASNGSWVSITSNEYTALQTNVSNTSLGMVSPTVLALASNGTFSAQAIMLTNQPNGTDSLAIPANSYLYAAVYRYGTAGQTGLQLYRNTASNVYSNFTQVGSDLPTTVNGYNYVVLKDPNATLVSNASLAAMWTNSADPRYLLYAIRGGNTVLWDKPVAVTSSTTLSTASPGYAIAIQTLSTTSKQW